MLDRFERFSFAISGISRCWHKVTTDEMEKHGLKGTHSVYLVALTHFPEGVTAPRLGEVCGRDKADVSRMMNIMEKEGLVVKEGERTNRYGGIITLTDKGKELAEIVSKRASRAVELAGKDLTEEQREIFYMALESISDNLRQMSKEGIPE